MPVTYQIEGADASLQVRGSGLSYVTYSNGVRKLCPEGESILQSWPSHWHMGVFNRNLAEMLGLEFAVISSRRDDVQAQLSVATATWGLSRWERLLNLPIRLGDTDYVSRRADINTALFSRSLESELYFVAGIQLITGTAPLVTLGDPSVSPYSILIEVGGQYFMDAPDAPTAAADAAPGFIVGGDYTYKVTFVYGGHETFVSDPSGSVNRGTTGSILVSDIPLGEAGCQARKIYRKETGGPDYVLVGTLSDNITTTLLDTVATPGSPIAPDSPSALSEVGRRVSDYIAAAKPAHLSVEVTSESFRAGISEAGNDAV